MAGEVKFTHYGMTGAPTLTGTVGGMIALLDAILINGFGLGTADSVVIAGGVATVTRSAGHPFEVGSVALIAGATVSGGSINGEKPVLSTTGTTYTFDATGIADQTATGTITHKVAPLGWTKEFTGTNVAVYKSSDPSATDCRLRVDDTSATVARVVGYETMSDVNTGTNPFPTSTQISGGGYWPKSNTADGTTRQWFICGDALGFYLGVNTSSLAPSSFGTQWFGDGLPNRSTDVFFCTLSSGPSNWASIASGFWAQADMAHMDLASDALLFVCRGMSGLGASRQIRRSAGTLIGNSYGFSGVANAGWIAYPNPGDNGLYTVPMTIMEPLPTVCFRGVAPGLQFIPQGVGPSTFAAFERVTGVVGLSGRALRAIPNFQGCMFVDATGPWR